MGEEEGGERQVRTLSQISTTPLLLSPQAYAHTVPHFNHLYTPHPRPVATIPHTSPSPCSSHPRPVRIFSTRTTQILSLWGEGRGGAESPREVESSDRDEGGSKAKGEGVGREGGERHEMT